MTPTRFESTWKGTHVRNIATDRSGTVTDYRNAPDGVWILFEDAAGRYASPPDQLEWTDDEREAVQS